MVPVRHMSSPEFEAMPGAWGSGQLVDVFQKREASFPVAGSTAPPETTLSMTPAGSLFEHRKGLLSGNQFENETLGASDSSDTSVSWGSGGGKADSSPLVFGGLLAGSAWGGARSSNQEALTPSSSSEQQLFVGGISRSTYEGQLSEYFSQFGELVEVIVMRHKKTGISRCFGFISYLSNDAVDSVLSLEHHVDGRRIEVKRAVPRHLLPRTPSAGAVSQQPQQDPAVGTSSTLPSSSSSLFFGSGDNSRTMILGRPDAVADVNSYFGLHSKTAALIAATRRARERVLLPAWNQKLKRKHREDMKELQYQINCNYENCWGRLTASGPPIEAAAPRPVVDFPPPGHQHHQLNAFKPPPEVTSLEIPQERRLQQLAGEVLDFFVDVLSGRKGIADECYLRPLDDLWRKAMTLVCEDLNDLARTRHLGGQADSHRITLTHSDTASPAGSSGSGSAAAAAAAGRRSRKGKSIVLKFVAIQQPYFQNFVVPTAFDGFSSFGGATPLASIHPWQNQNNHRIIPADSSAAGLTSFLYPN